MANLETLSIVIPVYNEVKTIAILLDKIRAVQLPNTAKEIIIVDDGSSDGTREFLKTLTDCHVIVQEKNQGKGAALRRGFQEATGTWVLVQDADLEYDPEDYQVLLAEAREKKAQVVCGSRLRGRAWKDVKVSTMGFLLGGIFLTVLTNILYRTRLTDEPTCYKLFRRDLLMGIPLKCNRFEFCPEVTAKVARQHIPIYEVPIRYYPRSEAEGKKIKFRDGWEAIVTLLKYRFFK